MMIFYFFSNKKSWFKILVKFRSWKFQAPKSQTQILYGKKNIIYKFFQHYYNIIQSIKITLWYLFESVGWIIWLRWDYQRWWKACKEGNSQRGDRRWPAKPPPMRKLVWSSKCFGDFCSRDFLPYLVRTGPLYRGLGVVIFLVTSPRFMEAREFGYNFPNG